MRFPFVARQSAANTASLTPYVPIRLGDAPATDADGLLDTGSAVNVLPWSVGTALGLAWYLLKGSSTCGDVYAGLCRPG